MDPKRWKRHWILVLKYSFVHNLADWEIPLQVRKPGAPKSAWFSKTPDRNHLVSQSSINNTEQTSKRRAQRKYWQYRQPPRAGGGVWGAAAYTPATLSRCIAVTQKWPDGLRSQVLLLRNRVVTSYPIYFILYFILLFTTLLFLLLFTSLSLLREFR